MSGGLLPDPSVTNPIGQSGRVTPGNIAIWTTDGVVQDSGFRPTPPSVQTQTGGAYNIKDFGAVGDGNSHPLSGVTLYLGMNTTDWTLEQWQVVFPFATSLSNELDHCSAMQAIIAGSAAGKAVWIPSGIYLAAETLPITLAVPGPLVVFGDGRGASRCQCQGAFDWFNLTVQGTISAASSISFREMSVYQGNNILGGQGIAITGPAANSGRPTVALEHCDIGNITAGPAGTIGAFTVGANFLQTTTVYASGCNFGGSQTGGGTPQGIGIRVNGNSTFISFGPVVTGCQFYVLDKAMQAGDGTAAWVQGVQVDTCNIVDCNYGTHWVVGTSSGDNDGLTMVGTTTQCAIACILADGIQVMNVTGNYFLSGTNTIGIHIQNTRGNNCFLQAVGNSFLGFGQTGAIGVQIDSAGGAGQIMYFLTGNLFQSFDGSGSVPIVLASGNHCVTVVSNTFSDCATATDAGTNVWYSNVSTRTNPAAQTMYITGIPGPPYAADGGLAWNTAGTAVTYWDPAAESGAGAVHFTSGVEIDGLGYFPGNVTIGGLLTAVGGASFSGAPVNVDGNTNFRLTGQISGAGSGTGTLTNAPSAGNPNFWVPVLINGTTRYIPAW